MTNKEIFKTLPKEVQRKVVRTLSVHDKLKLYCKEGVYKIDTFKIRRKKILGDFSFVAKFKAKEFFDDIHWYSKAWYAFVNKYVDMENEGVIFEEIIAGPIREEARLNYLK